MKKLALLALSLVSLTSCFDQGKAEPIVGSIGVSMPALTGNTTRWKNEMGQLKDKFTKARFTVAFGSCQDNDPKVQATQLKDMTSWKVENLIIASSNTYSDTINKALDAYVKATGGKVLCYDRLQMNTKNVDLFIAPSFLDMGVMQYDACRDLPDGSTIEILAGPSSDANSKELFAATIDLVKLKLNLGKWRCPSGRITFEEVSQETWNYDVAMVYMAKLLNDYYPNGKLPDAIIAANDAQADGVARAVELYNEIHRNEPHYPIITGMDNTDAARKRIAQGKQTMTIDRNPTGMVNEAYDVIMKWRANEPIKTSKTVNNGVKDVSYLPLGGVKPIYKKDIK